MTDINHQRQLEHKLQHVNINTDEYHRRLRHKIAQCPKQLLVHWLLDHAYEGMIEEFNNEIISEWEAEQEDDDD